MSESANLGQPLPTNSPPLTPETVNPTFERGDSASGIPIVCWRCGQSFPVGDAKCPHCRAANRAGLAGGDTTAMSPLAAETTAQGGVWDDQTKEKNLVRLVWLLIALMTTSILASAARALGNFADDEDHQRVLLLVVEGLDTAIILYGLARIPWPRLPESAGRRRLLAWLSAGPLLVGLLGINVGYHHLLRAWLQVPEWAIDTDTTGSTGWTVLAVCVQPALVEETFFRFLAIGLLCTVTQPRTALVVSAIMFGMAHSGVPLSIPYLIFLGLVLGQLYYWSRNLALPMLAHFVHNVAVTWLV